MKYIVVLTSPSHHLMNEQMDYFKAYEICGDNEMEVERLVELREREFSLEFKVGLGKVQELLRYRVKA